MNFFARIFGKKRAVVQDEYIDWSKVPESYNWVACANDEWTTGLVKLFVDKPTILMGSMYECWLNADGYADEYNAIIGPLPAWRDSLRKRPSK
jgi:hypothetical protein